MIKLRYFLIAVVVVSLIILMLSVSGLWQITSNKDTPSGMNGDDFELDEEPYSALKEGREKFASFENANQMIYGLRLPIYDESGQETSVVRSKYAALFDNSIYSIKEPIIEFKNISKKKDGSGFNNVVVTADEGIMEVETGVGTLTSHVVIKLDDDTRIETDSLSYLPDDSTVFTNDEVSIFSKKMVIRGRRLSVNLGNASGVIEDDVEMEISEISTGNVFNINKEDSSEKDRVPFKRKGPYYVDNDEDEHKNGDGDRGLDYSNKSYVKGNGRLAFDLKINAITFFDDVEAFVGGMTVFTDKLRVVLGEDKDMVKKIIADGNVLVMSDMNVAKGDKLVWDAETGVINIEDKNESAAEFLNDRIFVTSMLIRLYQSKGWVEVPTLGKLTTKSRLRLFSSDGDKGIEPITGKRKVSFGPSFSQLDQDVGKEAFYQKYKAIRANFRGEQSDRNNLNISWKDRMLFKNDEHIAKFEEDVEVLRENLQMNAASLEITFTDKNDMKSIVAKEDVYINEKKRDYVTEIEADKMTWVGGDKPVELIGDPYAKIKLGGKQLASSKILIFEEGNRISAEDKGHLIISVKGNRGGQNKISKNSLKDIRLEWQGNMEFNRFQSKASFYDNIEAFKDGLNIRCDVFNVFFDKDENVKKIVAMENVYISSAALQNMEGLGTMLTWDIVDNIAILTGDPVAELRKGGSRTLAKRVFFNINTRQVTWDGRTEWQMYKENEENRPKSRPLPTGKPITRPTIKSLPGTTPTPVKKTKSTSTHRKPVSSQKPAATPTPVKNVPAPVILQRDPIPTPTPGKEKAPSYRRPPLMKSMRR